MADQKRKIRVVVAKPGLDGHDRGAKIIARALRDAGMEVIYTGLHQTPEQIVETVLQEDAHAVGLSILSGAHMTLVPRIAKLLDEQGAEEVVLVLGGTIPQDDIPELKELGVAEVFTPGSSVQEIVDYIQGAVRPSRPRCPTSGPAGGSPAGTCSAASACRASASASTRRCRTRSRRRPARPPAAALRQPGTCRLRRTPSASPRPPPRALVAACGVKEGERVLDWGCGQGEVALAAARLGAHVTGVDFAAGPLERALGPRRGRGLEIEWLEQDGLDLMLGDSWFDHALSGFGVIWSRDMPAAVRELFRVTRPGGTVGFTTWANRGFFGEVLRLSREHDLLPRAPSPSAWGCGGGLRDSSRPMRRAGGRDAGAGAERWPTTTPSGTRWRRPRLPWPAPGRALRRGPWA